MEVIEFVHIITEQSIDDDGLIINASQFYPVMADAYQIDALFKGVHKIFILRDDIPSEEFQFCPLRKVYSHMD